MTAIPGIPNLTEETPGPTADLPPLQGEVGTMPEAGPGPGPDQPKRRGRPPKASQTAAVLGPDPEEVKALQTALVIGWSVLGRIVAARRGDHWLLREEEAQILGETWGTAVAPYLGSLAGYGPLITASLVTLATFGPRIDQDAKLEADRKAAELQARQAPPMVTLADRQSGRNRKAAEPAGPEHQE